MNDHHGKDHHGAETPLAVPVVPEAIPAPQPARTPVVPLPAVPVP